MHPTPRLERSRLAEALPIALIVALGIAFRFAFPNLVRFTYDNAYPIVDALRLLDGGQLLRLGQSSSVFVNNPPLMAYIEALPLLLLRSPQAVVAFIAALNSLSVLFVYLAARRLIGRPGALVASFLIAVNPWMVFYSRSTWLPALLPALTAFVAWKLWPALTADTGDGRRPARTRAVLAGLLGVTILTQTYVMAFAIVAQVALLLLLFRKRVPPLAFWIGLAVFVAATGGYVLALANDGAAGTLTKLQGFTSGGAFRLTREGIDHAIRLVTGRDFEWVYTQDAPGFALRRTAMLVVHYALLLALAAGVARALVALFRRGPARPVAAALLLWFGVPVVLMTVARFPVNPYYLLVSCPAGFVLAGWAVSPLLRQRAVTVAVLIAGAALAAVFGMTLFRAEQQVNADPYRGGFDGWPLSIAAEVGAELREHTAESGSPNVVSSASPILLSAMSATRLNTLEGIDYPDFCLVSGTDTLIYLLDTRTAIQGALGPTEEWPPVATVRDGSAQATLQRVWPIGRDQAEALPTLPIQVHSEVGLTLLEVDVAATAIAGQSVEVTTYWTVDELMPGRETWYVSPYYHLLDDARNMLANVSRHGRYAASWRVGDVYIERTQLAIPTDAAPGTYSVEIGLLDQISTQSYALLAPDGSSITVPVQIAGE